MIEDISCHGHFLNRFKGGLLTHGHLYNNHGYFWLLLTKRQNPNKKRQPWLLLSKMSFIVKAQYLVLYWTCLPEPCYCRCILLVTSYTKAAAVSLWGPTVQQIFIIIVFRFYFYGVHCVFFAFGKWKKQNFKHSNGT